MSINMIWKCEACGVVFSSQEEANAHLEANTECAMDEVYIKEGFNGKSKKIAIQSPDNSTWQIAVDNDGNLNTSKI